MTPQPSLFLTKLSGELRNGIYRLVLLKDSDILVSPSGYERIPLVSTCKAIRSEALKIFYLENRFTIHAPNWSCAAVVKWKAILDNLDLPAANYDDTTNLWAVKMQIGTTIGANGSPNWPNLLEWLREIHIGRAFVNQTTPEEARRAGVSDVERFVLINLFWIVGRLKVLLNWQAVREVVLQQRPILGMCDRRWLDDTA